MCMALLCVFVCACVRQLPAVLSRTTRLYELMLRAVALHARGLQWDETSPLLLPPEQDVRSRFMFLAVFCVRILVGSWRGLCFIGLPGYARFVIDCGVVRGCGNRRTGGRCIVRVQ